MEVLEKREALADAKSARDEAKVRALEEEIAGREKKIEETLAHAKTFDSALVPKLGEMRFYRRFLDEADAVLDALRDL